MANNQLTYNSVRKRCSAQDILSNSITKNESYPTIIGQNRALKALQFGLGIKAPGFNIFASGAQGTGKLSAVKSLLDDLVKKAPTPTDWCYVNNFSNFYQPTKLQLPAGHAVEFKADIKNLVQDIQQALLKAFEHEDFLNRRKSIIDFVEQRHDELLNEVKEEALKESILIEETPVEMFTVPMKDGKEMPDEDFEHLTEDEKSKIRKKQDKYADELKKISHSIRKIEKNAKEEIQKLEKETATFSISGLIDELQEKYIGIPDITSHIKNINDDILSHLSELFISQKETSELVINTSFIQRYDINILIDNSQLQGAPVIVERNPTYTNLFGRVEKESQMGTWVTDITLIRKGSFHMANGGYLIIRVEELFKNLFTWESLKRAIKNKEIVIEEAGEQWGFLTTTTLKPEPIPLNVKVILIGDPQHYHLLYTYDADFKELFKVKADFDCTMIRDNKTINDYVKFCQQVTKEENLLPLNTDALAKIIEHGSRLAEDQNKLSTQFNKIKDIIREANYYSSQEQGAEILPHHIQKTIEEKIYRSNLMQEEIHEMIITNQMMIDIESEKVGQVNGLSVIDLGDIEFGTPSRITCSTGLGKEGIIAIEREAELSGPIHTKGVMILTGYLTEKYAQHKPISLNARIVFEQSYSEIEGDSASSSELYAILSSLSGLPIKQGIAVTGSVNQKGEIQAVGGVTEKVEGYYEVCKLLKSDKELGVIIPRSNIQNLMLKEEVQEAVKQNKFKIWAISSIDEGIEILTGYKAGSPELKGTVAYLVNNKLNDYAEKMKEFSSEEEHEII